MGIAQPGFGCLIYVLLGFQQCITVYHFSVTTVYRNFGIYFFWYSELLFFGIAFYEIPYHRKFGIPITSIWYFSIPFIPVLPVNGRELRYTVGHQIHGIQLETLVQSPSLDHNYYKMQKYSCIVSVYLVKTIPVLRNA